MSNMSNKEITISLKISTIMLVVLILPSVLTYLSQIILKSPNILNPEVDKWSIKKKIVRHEIIANNCDGRSPSMTVSRSIALGKMEALRYLSTSAFGLNFPLDNGVAGNIMSQVESEYQKENVITVTETTEIQLDTPPNSIVTHYIFWEETIISAIVKFRFLESTQLEYPISISLNDRQSIVANCESVNYERQNDVDPPAKDTIEIPSRIGEENIPIRQHHTTSAGTGVFENVTYSDGMAPYSYENLIANGKFNFQRVRKEENPNGCAIALYTANKVWFTGENNLELLVNGKRVGVYQKPADSHGYVLDLDIKQGDSVCVSSNYLPFFSLIFGPDMYYQYDSYCYRGHCN